MQHETQICCLVCVKRVFAANARNSYLRDLLTLAVESFSHLKKSPDWCLKHVTSWRRPHAAKHCPHVRKPLSSGHRHQAVDCNVLPSMQAGLLCKLCKLCKVQHVPRALERKLRYVQTKTGHMEYWCVALSGSGISVDLCVLGYSRA